MTAAQVESETASCEKHEEMLRKLLTMNLLPGSGRRLSVELFAQRNVRIPAIVSPKASGEISGRENVTRDKHTSDIPPHRPAAASPSATRPPATVYLLVTQRASARLVPCEQQRRLKSCTFQTKSFVRELGSKTEFEVSQI